MDTSTIDAVLRLVEQGDIIALIVLYVLLKRHIMNAPRSDRAQNGLTERIKRLEQHYIELLQTSVRTEAKLDCLRRGS